MTGKYDLLELDKKIQRIPAEMRVEILWDVIATHKEGGVITSEDIFFFKRIAFKLKIDKSLVDLMLH